MEEARYIALAGGKIIGLYQNAKDLADIPHHRQVKHDDRFADKIIMPGFIDPHLHPMLASVLLPTTFITPEDWTKPDGFYPGVQSETDYHKRLKQALAQNTDPLFISWGHHAQFHGPLNRQILDRIAPDQPVLIIQRSFHEFIFNTSALKLAGLGDRSEYEAAMKAARANPADADFAKGIFTETALPAALGKIQNYTLSPQKLAAGFAIMKQMMRQNGVTTISDMATGIFANFDVEAGLIKAQFDDATTPARVQLVPLALNLETDPALWLNKNKAQYGSGKIRLEKRVKLLADGAFFAQYMQMNPPGYLDGHKGKWITPPELLAHQARRFWQAGWSLHIHVNGDKGLDEVLKIVAALPPKTGQDIVLEHLGYSTEEQNARIAALGLMVSAQPNYVHVLADAYAQEGLGPKRAHYISRLGSLEKKGVPLGLHSDLTMAPVDPLYLAWAATTRTTLNGLTAGAPERISMDKAMRAITIDAARMIGMEKEVGSLAPGKKADLVILSEDPYQKDAANLRDIKVEGLVFEGRYHGAGK